MPHSCKTEQIECLLGHSLVFHKVTTPGLKISSGLISKRHKYTMKTIKLLKDHEHYGTSYKAGDSIEVSDEDYKFLMDVYLKDRQELVSKIQEADKTFKKGAK